MRIVHVVSTFSPEHGGPSQSIGDCCEAQYRNGYEVSIYTLKGFPGVSHPRLLQPAITQQAFAVSWPSSLGYSAEFQKFLPSLATPDVFHLYGVWHLAQVAAAREARKRGCKFIYHPIGGFTAYELQRKALKKRLARWLYQDRLIRSADCLHANSEGEAAFLRTMGFRNPIVVLPVGVDVRPKSPAPVEAAERLAKPIGGRRILLYLARIHPTKGIEILLEAWQALASRFPEWILLIAGTGEAKYAAKMRALAGSMGLADRVCFAGMVSEDEKVWCYQNASVYVLPSFQENFGNTVAEALSHGVPVITTTHTPWSELETERCGWRCTPTVPALTDAIEAALSQSEAERKAFGERGARLVRTKYSIDSVIARLDKVYRWLLGGDRPEFVRLQ
jgi:glycosyltransferase involved in cell wall biosynthesis